MAPFTDAIKQMDTYDLGGVILGLISAMLMTAGIPSVFGIEFTNDLFANDLLKITLPMIGVLAGLGVILLTNAFAMKDFKNWQAPEIMSALVVVGIVAVFAFNPPFVGDFFTGSDPSGPAQAVVSIGVALLLGVVSAYPVRKGGR